MTVRENSDELTLRAEDNHIEEERWGLPWLITTSTPSVRRCSLASKEKAGEKSVRPTRK